MDSLLLILAVLFVFLLIFQVFIWNLKKKWSEDDKKYFKENWEKILNSGDLRHQIMDADKLLDQMLKRRGYGGTLGEKLKKHGQNFSDLNGLWTAHKLRNKFAHELGFNATQSQVNRALKAFERAFKDLGLKNGK